MKTHTTNSRSVNEGWFDSLLRRRAGDGASEYYHRAEQLKEAFDDIVSSCEKTIGGKMNRPIGESKFLHAIHRQLVREGADANLLLRAVDNSYQPHSTVQLLDRIAVLLRQCHGVGQSVFDHLAKMRRKAESYDRMRLDDRDRAYERLSQDFRYILEQDPQMSLLINRTSRSSRPPVKLDETEIRSAYLLISKTFDNKYWTNLNALKRILRAVNSCSIIGRKERAIITACEGLLGLINRYKDNTASIQGDDIRAYERFIAVLEKEIGSDWW